MIVDVPASQVRPGDIVVGPFVRRAVIEVHVHRASIYEDDTGRTWPGVVVHYGGGHTGHYLLNAQLTVDREEA